MTVPGSAQPPSKKHKRIQLFSCATSPHQEKRSPGQDSNLRTRRYPAFDAPLRYQGYGATAVETRIRDYNRSAVPSGLCREEGVSSEAPGVVRP